jgi:hypothetical protein
MIAWVIVFLLQVFAGIFAGVAFNNFERGLAGLLAGGVFLCVALLALYVSHKYSLRWRKLNFVVVGVYAIGFCLPLFLTRISQPLSQPVTSVLGLPQYLFHQGATYLFMVVTVVCAAQIGWAFWLRLSQRKG